MQLRVLGGPVDGMVGLIALVLVVKLADTGAYTVGRLIGRHKMALVISPGKTLEAPRARWALPALCLAGIYISAAVDALCALASMVGLAGFRADGRIGWFAGRFGRVVVEARHGRRIRASGCPDSAACSTCWIPFCSPLRWPICAGFSECNEQSWCAGGRQPPFGARPPNSQSVSRHPVMRWLAEISLRLRRRRV